MKKIKMMEVVELMKKVGLNKVEVNGLFLEIKESGMVSTNALIEGFESLYDSVYNLVCETEIKENDLTPASERYFSEETVCVNEAPVVTVVEEVAVAVVEEVVTIENIVESSLSAMFYTDSCRKHNEDRLTSMLFVRPGQLNEFI